jgi:hypothetical protein
LFRGADLANLVLALEAEKLSKADIESALATSAAAGGYGPMPSPPTGPFPAEELIPIVDDPAVDRWGLLDQAAEADRLKREELPEQLTPNGDERAREWAAKQPPAALRDMPLAEKLRMIHRMLDGWVSAEDMDGIARLVANSTPADKAVIRTSVLPRETSLYSFYQRTQLRLMFSPDR